MAWAKTTWKDDDGSGTVGTPYSASVMQNIETGIEEALAQGLIGESKEWPGINLPTVPGATYMFEDGTAISRTTYKALFEVLCLNTTANRTSGSKALKSIPSTTGMVAGMPISGTGIKAGTTIETVNSSTEITMSQTAESSGEKGALVVAPHGVGDGSTTFNLPDSRGRVTVGTGTNADVNRVGKTDGVELASRSPKHVHTGPAHKHEVNITSGANSKNVVIQGGSGGFSEPADRNHTHLVSGNTGEAGTGNTGSSGPSYIAKNRIIRVL